MRTLSPLNLKFPLISSPNKNATVADTDNAPGQNVCPPCPFKEIKPIISAVRQSLFSPAHHIPANDTLSSNTSSGSNSGDSTLACDTWVHGSTFPVIGPFDLLHCIQTGGYGAAWAARDQTTGRLLCLKAFRSMHEPGIERAIHTEFKLFRRIVKSKAGERGKQFIMELVRSIQHYTNVFFAMELMTADLGMYLYLHPERCRENARRWMAQMALGIQSLHDMGILHRDIKSENVLIDSRENIRIIDFGLAYLNPTCKPLCQRSECAVDFLGTAPYMAPEVLRNRGIPAHRRTYYGIAVDWWALGCILFELESQDHELLFETEYDLRAYIAWTEGACQSGDAETYPSFLDLDPVVVHLLERLLKVHSSERYTLKEMERHEYFFRQNGTSEFDNATARALERPICPELVPQFTQEDEAALIIPAAELGSMYDWTNWKWECL